jgi:hypothetical protein
MNARPIDEKPIAESTPTQHSPGDPRDARYRMTSPQSPRVGIVEMCGSETWVLISKWKLPLRTTVYLA